jgi:hypothetical protein
MTRDEAAVDPTVWVRCRPVDVSRNRMLPSRCHPNGWSTDSKERDDSGRFCDYIAAAKQTTDLRLRGVAGIPPQ